MCASITRFNTTNKAHESQRRERKGTSIKTDFCACLVPHRESLVQIIYSLPWIIKEYINRDILSSRFLFNLCAVYSSFLLLFSNDSFIILRHLLMFKRLWSAWNQLVVQGHRIISIVSYTLEFRSSLNLRSSL